VKAIALRRAGYKRMRWRNGAGWTTELAVHPADASVDRGFDWRLSVAEIDADSDFSAFPDYDRTILLLEGNGMELALGDGSEPVMLNVRGAPFRFSGATTVHCRLLDGPSRDFNVMVRRGRLHAKTSFRPLLGPMVFFPEPDVAWAIHVASGTAQVQGGGVALETGDTLLLEPDGTSGGQTVLAGGGELVLVRFEPIQPD
jgi:environmental stress-induced protein Ves